MEDQKHTPLTWRCRKRSELWQKPMSEVIDADSHSIAIFYGDQHEANAQLFMDAPGMKTEIEALKAEHDAAIESMRMYQRVEVTKLKAERDAYKNLYPSFTDNPY